MATMDRMAAPLLALLHLVANAIVASIVDTIARAVVSMAVLLLPHRRLAVSISYHYHIKLDSS